MVRHRYPCRFSTEIADSNPDHDYCTCPKQIPHNPRGNAEMSREHQDRKRMSPTTQIVLFNGPPSSGKDHGASLFLSQLEKRGQRCAVDKFARVLKEACHAAYGIFVNGKPAPHNWFEPYKNNPRAEFFGKTPRSVYIGFSEKYAKPTHGPRIFGELLLRQLRIAPIAGCDVIAISDSGFREEAEVLVEHYGATNCTMVRLHTPGTSFDGDSRGWVSLSDLNVREFDIVNPLDAGFLVNLQPVLDLWNTPQREAS